MAVSVFIVLGIVVFSWFHVSGEEIDGALDISSECMVTIRVGCENEREYILDGERIEMLKTLILTSSFTRKVSAVVTYPAVTEHYTILIDWNNQKDFLIIHSAGNKYISIANQFDGENLKVNNPDWEIFLKRIISLSKPS
jgi:hypothetical protein